MCVYNLGLDKINSVWCYREFYGPERPLQSGVQ